MGKICDGCLEKDRCGFQGSIGESCEGFIKKDTTVWTHGVDIPPIGELCESLRAKFIYQERQISRLKEENKKLKEGLWAIEEMSRLREENKRLKEEWLRGFPISRKESESIRKWESTHPSPVYKYTFQATSLGTSGVITDIKGNSFEFQEIS